MMSECPDKDTLLKLLENDLPEDVREKMLGHVSSCEQCRHIVKEMAAGEEELISAILAQSASPTAKREPGAKKCLSKKALLAYAVDSLSIDQLKLVEHHLETCDNCLTALMKIQKAMAASPDMDFDTAGMQKTAAAQVGTQETLLEIILKAKDNLIELIQQTGELLTLTPQYGMARGKESASEAPIVIRKDFQNRDLSIEITIQRAWKESGSDITVSVMKLSSEEFLSGVEVSLSGDVLQRTGTTDDEGSMKFQEIHKGKYFVKVWSENAASITLS